MSGIRSRTCRERHQHLEIGHKADDAKRGERLPHKCKHVGERRQHNEANQDRVLTSPIGTVSQSDVQQLSVVKVQERSLVNQDMCCRRFGG